MSVREFRVNTGTMRRDVDRDEEVVLTANGRPFAIVSAVRPECFDKELRAIRRARAKMALERVPESAALAGTADMPMAEIDAIIEDTQRACFRNDDEGRNLRPLSGFAEREPTRRSS